MNSKDESMPKRGFAAMTAEERSRIASLGGVAAQRRGTAHRYTTEEARAAGRKGGERVSADRAHMSAIGRLGGKRSAATRQGMRIDPPAAQETRQAA